MFDLHESLFLVREIFFLKLVSYHEKLMVSELPLRSHHNGINYTISFHFGVQPGLINETGIMQ